MATDTTRQRIAIIGCGDIARSGHIPAVIDHRRFELVALCDRNADVLDALRLQYGITQVTTDYRELLHDPHIDAVILAVHPEHSVDIAIDALMAGKPVLDEKPVAVDLISAARLKRTIDECRGIYQLGFVLRSCDWVQGIAQRAKKLGHPTMTQVNVYDEPLDETDSRHLAKIHGILRHSSAITHEGSHVIDYTSLWQTGEVRSIHSQALKTDDALPGPNLWHVMVQKSGGDVLGITIGWLLSDLPDSGVRVVGPNGWLEVDMFTGQGRGVFGGTQESMTLAPLSQAWDQQLDQFYQAMTTGRLPGPNVDDGIRALEITSACEQGIK